MRMTALGFSLLLLTPRLHADTPSLPPTGTSATAEVTLVEVPVHVTDSNGRPVRGLTRDDFELSDDGERVELTSVEAVDLEDFAKDPNAPRDIPLPPAARRSFFLLFDLSFSSPSKMVTARSAAKQFVLEGMKNGDFVGVATYDVERGMKLVLSFTADRDQAAHAVETLGLPSLTQPTADPLALTIFNSNGSSGSTAGETQSRLGDSEAAEVLQAISALSRKSFDSYQRGRIVASIKAMEDLARSLNSVRGRKHIIYFSEGFDSQLLVGSSGGAASSVVQGDQVAHGEIWKIDNDSRFGSTDLKVKLQDMLTIFNRADCVIHAVDVSGLVDRTSDVRAGAPGDTGPAAREGGRGRGQESLFLLAHETGGEVMKNSNDVAGQLESLERQTSLVYLLVFAPRKMGEPGRFHGLKVKVRSPGTRISARSGYYEPRPYSKLSPMERRLSTAQMLAYGLPRNEIPSRVLAAPIRVPGRTRAEVPVIVEIPGRALLAGHTGENLHLELYAYATDTQLRVRDFFSQNLTLELPKLRASLDASGIKYYGTVALPPGTFWMKVLVRNADTGRTGLSIVPVTVPEPGGVEPFVLAPLFHEAPGRWIMVKGAPRAGAPSYPFVAAGESFIPSAAPSVEGGQSARVSLFAYNVKGGTNLELEGRLRGLDGKDAGDVHLVRAGKDETGPGGALRLLCSFRPDGLAKGLYSLLVTVRDRESGTEAQSGIPVEVR